MADLLKEKRRASHVETTYGVEPSGRKEESSSAAPGASGKIPFVGPSPSMIRHKPKPRSMINPSRLSYQLC